MEVHPTSTRPHHPPPSAQHTGTAPKVPKLSKHKDGHRHKHKHKSKGEHKDRSKVDHKVKKEPLPSPVKRKPLIYESDSDVDIPQPLHKPPAQPLVHPPAQPPAKLKPAVKTEPYLLKGSRLVVAQTPPTALSPSTLKVESQDSASPIAATRQTLGKKAPENIDGGPASRKSSGKGKTASAAKAGVARAGAAKAGVSKAGVAAAVAKPGVAKTTTPKAGTKRKRADSDDEEDEEEFMPKVKRTPTSAGKKVRGRQVGARRAAAREASTASPVKGGRKKKEEAEVWKWWEEEPHPEGVKWLTLEHKGPYFAPAYKPLPPDVRLIYNGSPMELSLGAEEAAGFFAKMLDHDYTTKDVFCQNFFQDWRKEMTAKEAHTISDFSLCDFSVMHLHFKMLSEERKAMTKEDKAKLKAENEAILEEYGWAIVDGHRQRIGNFKTEPPGLFRGRGDHPKQGRIKKRIEAEDVAINIGKGATVPDPPEGHTWKIVQHDCKVTWLASWSENIQGQTKYVMLNPTSRLKGEKDWAKYEIARKLKLQVDKIRRQYCEDWKSKEMRIRQRAVAVYFIDKLALRAGNEKDADETADTVGCCSLRVEHLTLHETLDGKDYVVEFDFLGKDSIRYYNRVPVERQVFKNLGIFMKDKEPGDDLFDRLTTTLLNKHLQELMAGLTAKVFRTYNASKTLQEQVDELTEDDATVPEKLLSYNRANRAVAILCNHQRAPPKMFDKQMENLQAKIVAKEEAIVETRSEIKALRKEARSTKDPKVTKRVESKTKQLARLEEQLQKLEIQATDKQENKEIALGTSKLNYLDPRITVGWCKKQDVPIEKIYNKSQREKFAWAIDMVDETFAF